MKNAEIKLKRVTFELPEDLARRLKVMAAESGTTQTSIARRAIEKEIRDMTIVVEKLKRLLKEQADAKERKP